MEMVGVIAALVGVKDDLIPPDVIEPTILTHGLRARHACRHERQLT
jgi:hypothetical protein